MQAQIVHQGRLAALGTLAAGVAHELNTPLGYVRSNAQVLRHLVKPGLDEDRAEDVAELVGDIEEGANQMAQVVSNLRTFTQVDSQGAQLVSLNDSVRRSLEMLKGSQPAGVEMETSLSQIPEVEGYPAQLNQMVVNLVTNAWDACDGKGEIEVLTATEGDRVVFSVIDSGPGISEDVADRLFDPFFSTKTVGKNMGLGLSITRSIVEAHGGEITVANRSDGAEGAEARVSLPLGGRS
jgi:signal transduction histidine kinase